MNSFIVMNNMKNSIENLIKIIKKEFLTYFSFQLMSFLLIISCTRLENFAEGKNLIKISLMTAELL